jgi:16S rRNA (cytosine1402-N4)-methyltransferase
MRYDRTGDSLTAADLLRDLPERALEELLRELGDEPHARRIARAVVRRRDEGTPVTTTRELSELVERVRPRPRRAARGKAPTHPATQVFQALRMAVNREVEGVRQLVHDAVFELCPRGRLAIIAFHGGEDRIVKESLKDLAGRCTCPPELPRCACGRVAHVELVTKKPVWASDDETSANPRARSARMRVAQRLALA